jgi:hypothetical protein
VADIREIEEELLTGFITTILDRAFERQQQEEEQHQEEGFPEDHNEDYVNKPISFRTILEAATEDEDEVEDEDVGEELEDLIMVLREEVHHGAIVTTGKEHRGWGYYFVRNKNYPHHSFDPKRLEDWDGLELVPATGESGRGVPGFLAATPYVMMYHAPQTHFTLGCTIAPAALAKPVAAARALIRKPIGEKPEVLLSRPSGFAEEANKRIVGFAKDDLTSHASCLLLLTIPLNIGEALPDYFFSEYPVCARPPKLPRTKSAAQV